MSQTAKSPLGHGVMSGSWVTHESRHRLHIPRPSAGVFLFVAPVAADGVDRVAGDEWIAGFADDGDDGGGDQDQCCELPYRAGVRTATSTSFIGAKQAVS